VRHEQSGDALMIGQDYFDLRSRLGAALYALRGLVMEGAASLDHAAILENLVHSLKDPFVFVVTGEVNAGKSTFLNALFGAEFSKTGFMPTTDKIMFFKHGESVRHNMVSDTLEEVFVPAEFLRDFHVVDTPGTNSVASGHQDITERFVPLADLVLFVFSAVNPWGASAWQFLEKIHHQWMRNVIFILQQCDLREPEEVSVILDYMKQLSRQRFGREFPIFPVSAKKAYLARSSGLDQERLLADSGFSHLEERISAIIAGGGARLAKIANTMRIAQQTLNSLREQNNTRVSHREQKSNALAAISASLEAQNARTLAKLADTVDVTEQDFQREAGQSLTQLRGHLTARAALGSAWKERRSADALEKDLAARVRTASQPHWDRAAAILEDDIGNAAGLMGARLAETVKAQLSDDPRPSSSYWQAQKRRFLSRITGVVQRCSETFSTEESLPGVLARSRRLAWWQIVTLVLAVVGAGFCAESKNWIAGAIVLGLGVLLWPVLWIINGRQLRQYVRDLETKCAAAERELREKLTTLMQEETRSLYGELSKILQPLQEKLGEQQRRHDGLTTQINDLTRTFSELEAKLGSMGSADAPS
jgi:GTPase SAR1 family protein